MPEWSIDDVAARFAQAAKTARRLPRVRVQGYFNVWPAFVRDGWESFAAEEHDYHPLPPSPAAIEHMLETMRWVSWLEEEQRHLVWMRAKGYEWMPIARRFGYAVRTAQRHWQKALAIVTEQLNGRGNYV